MASRGHDGEPRRLAGALDEDTRLEAVIVFIAANDVHRHFELGELVFETVNSGVPILDGAQRIGRAKGGMLGKISAKVCKSTSVLVLELHARRTYLIWLDGCLSAKVVEASCHDLVAP